MTAQRLHPCDHEEADTRILVRTVDTDVIVILLGLFSSTPSSVEIWVAFGMGRKFRCYSIKNICLALGEEKSKASHSSMHLLGVTHLNFMERPRNLHGKHGNHMHQ